MVLISGGVYQGKKRVAVRLFHELYPSACEPVLVDAAKGDMAALYHADIIYNLHLLVKKLLMEKEDPSAVINTMLENNRAVIITTAELGCGIVPLDQEDRVYREITGRICCRIAASAEAVYRVTCGIATQIFAKHAKTQEELEVLGL